MDPDERKRKRRQYSAAYYRSNKRAAQQLDEAIANETASEGLTDTVFSPEEIDNIE